jgi:AcrR family transcriptional regulator
MRNDKSAPQRPKRIRRSPATLRAEALAAARRLVVENPGQQVTMRAVADSVGVTYPNIAHHFGSVGGLYAALGDNLVAELFSALKVANDDIQFAPNDAASLVDLVFDIFDRDGLAKLLEWLLRSSDPPAIEALKRNVALRIADFNAATKPDAAGSLHFRQLFILLGLAAYADVTAGKFFGDILNMDGPTRRALLADAVRAISTSPIDVSVNSAIDASINSDGDSHGNANKPDDCAS